MDNIVTYTSAIDTDTRKFGYYPPEPLTTTFVYFRGTNQKGDPRITNRWYKMLHHKHFPKYDVTVYHDARFQLTVDVRDLVRETLDNSVDMAAVELGFNCKDAYDVGHFCLKAFPDQRSRIHKALEQYRKEGYPQEGGCWQCGLLIRKNTSIVNKAMEDWWCKFLGGPRRDQISFPYIVWKHRLRVRTITTKRRDEIWRLRK